MKILPTDNSYATFCNLIGGYRMFCVMAEAVRFGIFDLLDNGMLTADELLKKTTLKAGEGQRFVDLLVNVGLLEQRDGLLSLSSFSSSFLSRRSPTSQRHVLEFEPVLMENWSRLGTILQEGQGGLVREQSADDCCERLQLFQQAMAEAAQVRSQELWDALTMLPERGIIIDIGAGDGSYLRGFLLRHPGWQGIVCDLPDVCRLAASSSVLHGLTFYPCNILDSEEIARFVAEHRATADLLLFSNICHCYSPDENMELLRQAGELVTDEGLLVIHDFFRDANSFGAIYDLHMLANTWNGRCYSREEISTMLLGAGFSTHSIMELPSNSLALLAARSTPLVSSVASETNSGWLRDAAPVSLKDNFVV